MSSCGAAGVEVARHPRHTAARRLPEPTHYDGASTVDVVTPPPLGRRGRWQADAGARLPASATVARPLDTYAALIDGARR